MFAQVKQLHTDVTKTAGWREIMHQFHQIVMTGVAADTVVNALNGLIGSFKQLEEMSPIKQQNAGDI